ncbi:MAG: CHAP domain-containing protein [Lachnospiraceae bacterium]|nr:CHAP domain-containing protein [Lachnospiraceae bacterium]
MTGEELRNKVVGIVVAWIGGKRFGPEHTEILDIYNGQKKLPRGYKVKPQDDYCATGYSAAMIKAGIGEYVPIECSCGELIRLASGRNKYAYWVEDDTYEPKIGDAIIYAWNDPEKDFDKKDNKTGHNHVGIVIKKGRHSFTVGEANMGDDHHIGSRSMVVNARFIRGYIHINYDAIAAILPDEEDEDMTGEEIYKKLAEYLESKDAPEWAKKEIAEAKELGITDGTQPEMFATRLQAAIMAKRAADATKKQ